MSHTSPAPAIRVFGSVPHQHHGTARALHHNTHSSQHSSSARPMAIPNAREAPPPPLPPPRHIGEIHQDLGWKYGNTGNGTARYGSVKPGSSLLGGGEPRQEYSVDNDPYDRRDSRDSRRGSNMSTAVPIDPAMTSWEGLEHSDEDRSGRTRPSLSSFRFQSENQLGQKALHTSAQAYDKQLLSKIGGPNTQNGGRDKFATQLKPLSVPDHHRFTSNEPSLSRWASAPSSAISPSPMSGFRSPMFENSSIDNAFSSSRWNHAATPDTTDDSTSGYRSHRNSDDHGVFLDPEIVSSMEENGLRDLNIHDRTPSGGDGEQLGLKGTKRRAPSPPSDGAGREDRAHGGGNDLYHRRSMQVLANRNSPVTRPSQQPGSLSSTASLGPRGGSSFASSWNLSVASSATSYSGERLSPSALSPSADSEFGQVSPYAASRNLNRSPRDSVSKSQPHHRKQSGPSQDSKMPTPTDSQAHSRQNSVSKLQGFFVCECCPKKPKKFENEDHLRVHEMEKQYQCAYCPNRFKNKNEAERHQNSLHLRRHSWSCAALDGVQAAFHESSIHPTTADVCGYCGDEFPNPPNWDVRAEHLCSVHKFGECNQAKKFFRADHFRQHLKHSHAGTSGKWTNMLEHACMKEEITPPALPPRVLVPSNSMAASGHVLSPGAFMGNGNGNGPYPGVINEVHEEL